jgi:DNA-binding ferritin-like protein
MAAIIQFFLQLRNQVKLYHWQTRVFARHMATDKILEELDESIDKFVEVMIGKMGTRPKLTGDNAVIRLQNLTEAGATRMVRAAIKHLQGPITRSLRPTDTDLLNIRDEMLGQLDQLLYLFSLH